MQLPLVNRKIAIMQASFACVSFVLVIVLLITHIPDFEVGFALIVFVLIAGGRHVYKQNLTQGELKGEVIVVKWNGKVITVPLTEIESIVPASSKPVLLNGRFIITYTLHLKRKYSFGNELLLEYSNEQMVPEESVVIKTIRAIRGYGGNG